MCQWKAVEVYPENWGEKIQFKGLSNTQCITGINLASGAERQHVHKHSMPFDVDLFFVL